MFDMALPKQACPLKKSAKSEAPPFLAGGGEMGALIRAYQWAATPLANPAEWPIELKTLVSLLLTSPQPMFIAWGDLSPEVHPAMGGILFSFEPVRLGDATGRGAEPST
jgi:hypothetical protein